MPQKQDSMKEFLENLNDDMSDFSETRKMSESSPIKHRPEDFLPTKRKTKMSKNKIDTVKVQKLLGAKLPEAKTSGAAGYDLCANNNFPIMIYPGDYKLIPTGLKLALPEGFCAEVYPRSGLAAKNGVTVLNTPGLIDSDFRGEVQVILINHGKVEFEVKRGDRIAQLRVKKLDKFNFEEVGSLDETSRGEGGFCSTGTKN